MTTLVPADYGQWNSWAKPWISIGSVDKINTDHDHQEVPIGELQGPIIHTMDEILVLLWSSSALHINIEA